MEQRLIAKSMDIIKDVYN
jgi:hypothetical protein